jgi:hypothetical protein
LRGSRNSTLSALTSSFCRRPFSPSHSEWCSLPEFRRSAGSRGGGRQLRALVVLLELAQNLVALNIVGC